MELRRALRAVAFVDGDGREPRDRYPAAMLQRWRLPVIAALVMACTTATREALAQRPGRPLDGAVGLIGIGEFSRTLELAGVDAAPEIVWDLHGVYLDRVLEIESAAAARLAALGVDPRRGDTPESLRAGLPILHGALNDLERAGDELIDNVARRLPAEARPSVELARGEMRVRTALAAWRVHGHMNDGFTLIDVAELLQELSLAPEELAPLRPILGASSKARVAAIRRIVDESLSARERAAGYAAELGIAGLTDAEFRELWRAAREDVDGADVADGEKHRFPTKAEFARLGALETPPADAALEAFAIERREIRAVAELLPPVRARQIQRIFRDRTFQIDHGWRHDASDVLQARHVALGSAAARILSWRELDPAHRPEVRRILEEWTIAEDERRERFARLVLEAARTVTIDDRAQDWSPEWYWHHRDATLHERFLARLRAIPGLDRLIIPEEDGGALTIAPVLEPTTLEPIDAALSSRLLQRWPEFEGQEEGEDDESTTTLGHRPVSDDELEFWKEMLALDDAEALLLDRLVDHHRDAWKKRVMPWRWTDGGGRYWWPPPPSEDADEPVEGDAAVDPLDLSNSAWIERVMATRALIDSTAAELDGVLFDGLQAMAGPEQAALVELIRFDRACGRLLDADRLLEVSVDHWGYGVTWAEALDRRRVNPVNVVRTSLLTSEARRRALIAMAETVAPLKAQIDAEYVELREVMREVLERELGERGPDDGEDFRWRVVQRRLGRAAEWRPLEEKALAAAAATLTSDERERLQMAKASQRFPGVTAHAWMMTNVALDLRRRLRDVAAADDRERVASLIDRAAMDALRRQYRIAQRATTAFTAPVPTRFKSLEEFDEIVGRRLERLDDWYHRVGPVLAERLGWLLSHVVPSQLLRASPAFGALGLEVELPPPSEWARTIAPP